MDCSRTREFLDENFLAGGYHLPPEVEAHIGDCPECRAAYQEMLALGETLEPLADITMTAEETARFETGLSQAIAETGPRRLSYVPENRIFSIARLALAAAAVLVMMAVAYNPDLPTGLALFQTDDVWQPTNLETEDVALMYADGDTDLLPSPMDDQTADYLTEQLHPAQAEDLLESVTAEELEWLQQNLTLEI